MRQLRPLRRTRLFGIDRRRALPLALGIAAVTCAVDAVTTSESVFTLFYLVPIGIAVWYHSRKAGFALVTICTVLSGSVDVLVGPHRAQQILVLWNLFGELGLYVVFAILINMLKEKLATEASLRREALTQLRHADRLTTIGRLAAGLAHELGTPLNVVSGKASLISGGRMAGDDAKRAARVIEQQADRMTLTIRHLLDFARRGGTGRQPTGMLGLARETAELLRPLALRSHVTIDCTGDEVTASVNRSEMQQVLGNLLTNAIHAMPHGGNVTVSTACDGETRVLTIVDQGEGIAPDVLPRIFDPFFTTKDVGQGTGLGLSVVHGIVDDHGGAIDVTSNPGCGATFVLRLPN